MINRRRKLFWLIFCLALVFALAGCSNPPGDGKESLGEDETFIFTDCTGRRVELPRHITRVASGGPLANIILYSLKPEILVGWSSSPPPTTKKYIAPAYRELPEYGRFYSDAEDFNREALMASDPEVIIDVGEWDEDYKLELDSLQEQLGIPVILLGGNLEENASTYRTLGQLLEVEERAEELAAYCEQVLADAREKTASIVAAERKRVYYGEGETGLSTILSGSIHSQIYELVGAEIVVEADLAQLQRGGGSISMEQLMALDPEVIMFVVGSIYETAGADPTWAALNAIRNNIYYEIPIEPYNWLGRPPGPNRLIGIRWLGNLLYPELYDYDIVQEVKEFFRLFYRYELSDEEVAALLKHSTLKAEKGRVDRID